METIEFDITEQLDTFNKLANDMPYIISRAMNDTAFDGMRKDIVKGIDDTMELRTKYMKSPSSIKVQKSNKRNLTIETHHAVEGMGFQEWGGVRLPKHKKIAVPIRKNLTKYAGLSNSKPIPKALKIQTLMEKAPKRRSDPVYKTKGIKPFILKRGVYIKTGKGNESLRMLYSFVDKAKYKKRRLYYQNLMNDSFNRKFSRNLNYHYLKVLTS